MRSFRWLLVPGCIVAAVLIVGAWIGSSWLNSVINSDAFRGEVETKAGQALGGTVKIEQIDFSIWRGVRLSGLATKLDSPQGTLVSQVERVSCSCSLLALLNHRLQLDGVNLVNPQVVLTQQPPSTVATPPPPPVPSNGTSTADAQSGKMTPFQVVLESAKITNGHLSIRDATGATKADLQGVEVSADTGGFYTGKDVTGKVRIANVSLPQNLNLTDFSTPFTYRAGTVDASPFEATAFSGRMTGDYKLDPTGPSLLEVNATGIDVSKIGQTANPNSSSKLSGSLALQSQWHGVETGKLTGDGDAQITGGKLRGVSILRDLAFALRVSSLSEPNLKSVTIHFHVANGTTHFTDLRIVSDDFDLTGEGVINAGGRLDAQMVLTLHGGAMGGIPGAASSLFSMLPGGAGSIPFHIGGTVASPRADLTSLLLMPGTKVEKTLDRTIGHFFH
jgi:uncharacterized protein involved in outer membrane biogenesis